MHVLKPRTSLVFPTVEHVGDNSDNSVPPQEPRTAASPSSDGGSNSLSRMAG